MCSLVTGGKGSSLYPTSTGAEAVSSRVASCVLMAVGKRVKNNERGIRECVYHKVVTPSLGES
jgi:hypothetical protein